MKASFFVGIAGRSQFHTEKSQTAATLCFFRLSMAEGPTPKNPGLVIRLKEAADVGMIQELHDGHLPKAPCPYGSRSRRFRDVGHGEAVWEWEHRVGLGLGL